MIVAKENGSVRIVVDGNVIAKICRCGQSKTPPFCDSSHKTNGFKAEAKEIRIAIPPKQNDGPSNPTPSGVPEA